MATNAAKELLKLIDSWDAAKTVAEARSTAAGFGGLWETQVRAVRLFAEVEAFLRTREDAAEYEPFVKELRRFVFASEVQWSAHKAAFDPRDRMQLKLMSELMATTPLRVALGPGEIDALRSSVEKCLEVLDLEPRQIQEGANYLRYLLKRCLDLLEGENVDLVALRHLSFEATGVAVEVAQHLPDERREPFVNAAGGLYRPWFGNVFAGATGNLIAEGVSGIAGLLGNGLGS